MQQEPENISGYRSSSQPTPSVLPADTAPTSLRGFVSFSPAPQPLLTPSTEAFQSWLSSEYTKPDASPSPFAQSSPEPMHQSSDHQRPPAIRPLQPIPSYLQHQQPSASASINAPSLTNSISDNSSSDASSLQYFPHHNSPSDPLTIANSTNAAVSFSDSSEQLGPVAPNPPKMFALEAPTRGSSGTYVMSETTHLPIPDPPQLEELKVQPESAGGFPFPQMPCSPKDRRSSLARERCATSELPQMWAAQGSLGTTMLSFAGKSGSEVKREGERSLGDAEMPRAQTYPFQSGYPHYPAYQQQPSMQPISYQPQQQYQSFVSYPQQHRSSYQSHSQQHQAVPYQPSYFNSSYRPASTSYQHPPPHPPTGMQPNPLANYGQQQPSTSDSASSSKRRKVSGAPHAGESSSANPSPILPAKASGSQSTRTSSCVKPTPYPSSAPSTSTSASAQKHPSHLSPRSSSRTNPRTTTTKREASPIAESPPAAIVPLLQQDDEFYLPPLPKDFGEYAVGGSSVNKFDTFDADMQDDDDEMGGGGGGGGASKGKKRKGSGEADFSGKDSYWGVGKQVYEGLSPKSRKQLRNKIGARRFRERRKEYISTLEERLAERDDILEDAMTRLEKGHDTIRNLQKQLTELRTVSGVA